MSTNNTPSIHGLNANKHIKTYYCLCMVQQGQVVGPSLFHYVQISRNVFDLLSSPHTDCSRLFICCYWSLYQYKKQSFVSVAVFSTFTNISSNFTLI